MTGPWTIRESGMPAGAVFLSLSIAYFVGKHNGQLDEKLSSNKTAIHASDSSTKSVQIRTTDSRRKDSVLFASHDLIRTKIRVVHDTIRVVGAGGDPDSSTAFVSPDIAQLIVADDSLIAAQKHSLALQDTLVASLRVGLKLRDDRIKLLEDEHSPRLGIKSGVAIGAVGTVAIVVVAVKVIQAFHK